MLDPGLRYLAYVWSSNTSQGQGAQVVVAGSMSYRFDTAFTLGAGIGALPGTRSLEGAWPRLLKVDSRTIADDYFRGSYTSGIWGEGKLGDMFQYKAMLGNNLSQLGVDATQLDNTLDTVSLALWCMPSTGEFGPNGGFGDFEYHEEVATRFGVHYTHSTEDRQSQPGKDDPENTQIRISDGTAIFDIGAFAPDTQIDRARYQMASLDAGLKYRGFALEGEYFVRWVDDIESRSEVPVRDPAVRRANGTASRQPGAGARAIRPRVPAPGILHADPEDPAGLSRRVDDLRGIRRPVGPDPRVELVSFPYRRLRAAVPHQCRSHLSAGFPHGQ